MGSVKLLIQKVAESTTTFEKGTDAQRVFNHLFGEICDAALTVMGVLEQYVIQNRRDVAVSSAQLLEDIALYVAQFSGRVTVGYLQQLTRAALIRSVQQAQKVEGTARLPSGAASAKRARTEAITPQRTQPSPILAPSSSADGPAVPPLERVRSGGEGGAAVRSLRGRDTQVQRPPVAHVVLAPWMLPSPFQHVTLERCVPDHKPKDQGGAQKDTSSAPSCPSVLDICLAPTGADTLALWEQREAVLGHAHATHRPFRPPPQPYHRVYAWQPVEVPLFPTNSHADAVPTSIISSIVHLGTVGMDLPGKAAAAAGSIAEGSAPPALPPKHGG